MNWNCCCLFPVFHVFIKTIHIHKHQILICLFVYNNNSKPQSYIKHMSKSQIHFCPGGGGANQFNVCGFLWVILIHVFAISCNALTYMILNMIIFLCFIILIHNFILIACFWFVLFEIVVHCKSVALLLQIILQHDVI